MRTRMEQQQESLQIKKKNYLLISPNKSFTSDNDF